MKIPTYTHYIWNITGKKIEMLEIRHAYHLFLNKNVKLRFMFSLK